MNVSVPNPSILDGFQYLGLVNGQRLWKSQRGDRYYTWDRLHGEVEVFNRRGKHIAVVDPISGDIIKDAVKGRKIDV